MKWPISTQELTDALEIHPLQLKKEDTPGVEWPPVVKAKRAWNLNTTLQIAAAYKIDNSFVKAAKAEAALEQK